MCDSATEARALVRGTVKCPGMTFWHAVVNGQRISLKVLHANAEQEGRL